MKLASDTLQILYDGDCPFCSNFVALYRIKENVGNVELTNVRERPDLVKDVRAMGYEINDGMIAIWQNKHYYGADAVSLMSMLSADKGAFAKLNRAMFTNPKVAGAVYPVLVRGRKLALKLMGRSLIE